MFWSQQKFKIKLFTAIFLVFGCFLIASPALASSEEGHFISEVKDAIWQVAWGTIRHKLTGYIIYAV